MNKNKHTFALFIPDVLTHDTVTIADRDLVTRIQHVLRLGVGDALILFNGTHNARACIRVCDKKSVTFALLDVQENKKLYPLTHCLFWSAMRLRRLFIVWQFWELLLFNQLLLKNHGASGGLKKILNARSVL